MFLQKSYEIDDTVSSAKLQTHFSFDLWFRRTPGVLGL